MAETLEHQLAPGGRLVVPVGESDQHLMLSRRTPDGIVRFKLEPVRFVPLVPRSGASRAPSRSRITSIATGF